MAIFTAIAGAISGALFAGSALATQIIAAGLSIGANLALSYLGREKAQTYSALQGEKEYGAAVPMTAAFGRVLVAGHEIEYFNYGKGDKYNTFVLALSNGWCHGLQPEIIFFGKSHTLTPIATIGNETQHFEVANFNSKIKIRFYDGRPDQAADAKLIADTAGLSNPWSATDTVTGHAYVIVDMEYDDTLYEDGFPEFQFILDGLRLYDPRKDSTFAGGSGTHRLADPATWEWSDNPAIQRLNYLIGPVVGQISGRTLIGMGKVVGQIDMTSHITAANVADQTRSIDGRTVKTYHANIIVNSTMDHTEVLKEFEDAMAGYALNNAGLSGVVVGAPQVPVMALTDMDIRVDEGREVSYRQSAFSAVNLLSGSYTSPVSLWQAEAFKPVTVNADVQADGRQREERNDFLQVINADIAQYLAHIRYRQNRLAGKATLPVSARFGHQVAAGAWITWAGRTWLITGWKLSNALKVTLTLAETSLAVYSETDIQPGPIYSPPIAPVNPSQISTVSDFAVAVGSIQGDGFNQTPALLVTWTPPEDPTVTDVIVSYWDQAAPGTVYQIALPDPEAGEATITQNVEPGVSYSARATIKTDPPRATTNTPLVGSSPTPPRTRDAETASLTDDLREVMDRLVSDVSALQRNVAQLSYDGAQLTTELKVEAQELSVSTETAQAMVRRERTVRASADSALASSITAVETTLTSLDGSVTTNTGAISTLSSNQQQIGTDLTAVGQSITQINSTLTNVDNTSQTNASAITALTTEVSSKAQTFYGASEPTGSTYQDNDLWIDTDNGNALHVWRTDQWVDASVAGMTVFEQNAAPATTVVGALWFDTDNDNALSVWNGSQWVDRRDERVEALSTSVTAVEATVNSLNATGLLSFEAVASPPSGVSSRIAILSRASASDTFVETGMFFDAIIDTTVNPPVTTSRITALADQFVLLDEDNPDDAIKIENGQIIMAGGDVIIDKNGLSGYETI